MNVPFFAILYMTGLLVEYMTSLDTRTLNGQSLGLLGEGVGLGRRWQSFMAKNVARCGAREGPQVLTLG